MSELKPCPFCGGVAAIVEKKRGFYAVRCNACLIKTAEDTFPRGAIEDWNLRASGWIKVSDMLPDVGVVVLLFTDLGGMDTGYRDDVCFVNPGGWYWAKKEDYAIGVTHWMPLPEPPND